VGECVYARWTFLSYLRQLFLEVNFLEPRKDEVRRKLLPRTPVNRGKRKSRASWEPGPTHHLMHSRTAHPRHRSSGVTLLGGTVFYSTVEGRSIVDALYFSVAMLTTVGLGDLAPKTAIGKIFTLIYIFAGLSIILGFIETVAKETLDRHTGRGGSEEGQENEGVSGS
jgi:hypothetical protein